MTSVSLARLKALLAVIFWGGSFIAVKVAVAQVSFYTLVWLRFAIGFLTLLALLLARREFRLPGLRETVTFAGLGFLGVFFHNTLQAVGLKTAAAGMSGLIVASNPIVIAVLGSMVLKESLSPARMWGILLAAFGILVILSRGDPRFFFREGISAGELLMIASVFSWAVFSVLSRRALQRTPALLGMTCAIFFGLLCGTVPFVLMGGYRELSIINPGGWAGILFLGIFCSALSYLFWYDALRVLPASEVGAFLYVNTVVSVIASVILLGEPATGAMMVGGSLVFIGVWMVNRK